jgi:aspartate racemase
MAAYPQFLINSIDLNKVRDFIIANDLERLTETIVAEIEKLARAGADFGLIAANTPHLVFDKIAERSSIPLISIVEAASTAAKAKKLKKLALFGTRFTMEGDFYPKVFAKTGIELVVPGPAEQDYIHDKYMNELVNGIFRDETRVRLLNIVADMKQEIDIDGVILAGTELPLILREAEHNGVPFLNTTKIHCQAAVAEMFS